MEVSRAIDLIDNKMCWGRGTFSAHHMPEYDEYWQAGEMAIDALKKQEVDKCCETCKHKHLDVDACPCCDCIRAKDHYIPYTGEEA